MSANFKTILVLGATSGLGEAFTRRFHAQGKKVIAAGRRLERLEDLKGDLEGLETFEMDVADFTTIESKIKLILRGFPTLDTVFLFSGKMELFSFKDPSTSTNDSVISEATVNIISPMIIARLLIPHFLSLQQPTSFVLVSSGLAFIPFAQFPVYCPTKAAIHSLAINLRSDLAGTNVNVIELAPPYVDTDLDVKFRVKYIEIQGGPEKANKPMPLETYMSHTMEQLAESENGRPLKEIAVGFSALGAGAWRGAYGPIFKNFGLQG